MTQKRKPFLIVCLVVIVCYLAVIGWINLLHRPYNYNSDMYNDMVYAQKAWEAKSFFPEGWVYGNQVYIAATPNVAALFYGITGDPLLSMSLASCLMTVVLLASLAWMLYGLTQSHEATGVGVLAFLMLSLLCGNPIYAIPGWHIHFTMCSYYACYEITAFLCFGCCLRKKRASLWLIVPAALLSFAMGVQSLRQTLLMVIPLGLMECARICFRLRKKQKVFDHATLLAAVFAAANLIGVIVHKMLRIPAVSIYGSMSRVPLSSIPSRVIQAFRYVFAVFSEDDVTLYLSAVAVIALLIAVVVVCVRKKDSTVLWAVALLVLSVGSTAGVYVFFNMIIRGSYFFMLLSLVALLVSVLYCTLRRRLQQCGSVLLAGGAVAVLIFFAVLPVSKYGPAPSYQEVSQYLLDNGISTIYSHWNMGQSFAIASDFQLEAGFWDRENKPFQPVCYLTDPAIYDRDPSTVAYLFRSGDARDYALETAGGKLHEDRYFSDCDVWVYRSDENLMQIPSSETPQK